MSATSCAYALQDQIATIIAKISFCVFVERTLFGLLSLAECGKK